MKKFQKKFRLFSLILLVIVASVGIGIAGAIPISTNKKRENLIEIKTELLDTTQKKSEQKTQKEIKG
ncbi:MAG: hypothetical protein V4667_04095 [Bacteroidota bacterium]